MRETGLRWKGRIGSLKALAVLSGVCACIVLLVLYGRDGETLSASIEPLVLCITALALLASVVPFFFPSTVFHPYPVDRSAGPSPVRATVKATGRFQQLEQLEPAIQVGERTRNFTNGVANIIPLAERRLLIYIRHTARIRYGERTSRATESDWGIFLDANAVPRMEPGKVYGWKDRWAVRFRYPGPKGQDETLLLTLESAAAQAQFVDLLQKSGFVLAASPLSSQS